MPSFPHFTLNAYFQNSNFPLSFYRFLHLSLNSSFATQEHFKHGWTILTGVQEMGLDHRPFTVWW
ncbi:hypothetical protein Hdeb2414_s0102g00794121 [Helianthus debilis subsp. tardiflorus]